MKTLPLSFFDRPAPKVARDILGCKLVRRHKGKIERFTIVEAEAYEGYEDKASHASRGKTPRNEIMFRKAGHIYVYFTYGMHWMLNIVTGPKDYPAAVLIRGLMSDTKNHNSNHQGGTTVKDNSAILLNGPAKLTKRLGIDDALNGKMLGRASGLWIEESAWNIPHSKIERTQRIGVDYAGPIWSKKKWRFLLK